ncbi:MAG: RDD family protein, partial [Zoogloeaceae bacterium]|nr:RDD family protein [Zoogloeaceae bacterium]
MNAQFESIVERLAREHGQAAFLNAAKCKSLLNDYAKNEYKKERHLLLLAIEAGVGKEIAAAADLANCGNIQVRFLKSEHFLDAAAAEGIVDLLAFVLRGHRGARAVPPRNTIPVSPRRQATSAANSLPAAQNAPPPISGGQHHPWRRYFARMVDLSTTGLLLLFLLMVAAFATMPEQAERLAKALDNPIIAGAVLCLVWLPVDAAFLSLFGSTPAKWLFGIRVTYPGGGLLSFSEALKRACLVWIQGLGFGIPLVVIFTHLFAYRRLAKTGTT